MHSDDLRAALAAACERIDLNRADLARGYGRGLTDCITPADAACRFARLPPAAFAGSEYALAYWAGVVMGHLLAAQE